MARVCAGVGGGGGTLEHPRTDLIFRFAKANGEGGGRAQTRRGSGRPKPEGCTARRQNRSEHPPSPLISTIRATQALQDFVSSHSSSMDGGVIGSENHNKPMALSGRSTAFLQSQRSGLQSTSIISRPYRG